MKQLAIISGKGGTGKTIISASFAVLARRKVMVDCDVDAANLYLLLHPEIQERHRFSAGYKAHLDEEKCTGCGECLDVCRFSAIEQDDEAGVVIDPISCEGCGVCSHICPVQAIDMEKSISGDWYVSQTKYGPFVHARLGIGEENSGKLVTEVRKKAKEIGQQNHLDYVIIDGPPGIGCPVIASLSGTDLALIVTEPTVSGIHDMERVIHMAHYFKTKTTCCINKFDLNPALSDQIEEWCSRHSIPVVGRVPYDEAVAKSVVEGIPLPEYSDNSVSRVIQNIWQKVSKLLVMEELNQ